MLARSIQNINPKQLEAILDALGNSRSVIMTLPNT